jgi:hypothetical protein
VPSKDGSFDPSVDNFHRSLPQPSIGTAMAGFWERYALQPESAAVPQPQRELSVAKSFTLHEQMSLDFRAEAFNAFNRVRFSTGSGSLQSQSFGRLTSNGDLLNSPRQMQMALKVYW